MKNETINAEIEKALPRYNAETEILSVCGCCWPGQSVLEVYPQFTGFEISHGTCPICAQNFLAEFYKLQALKNAKA